MPVATRRQLLEAGVHFGHQTRRWNPKMRRYIFGERGGIYIVDLEKTLEGLSKAYDFVRDIGRRGGTLMFVGTKKQAQDIVSEQAARVGMPFVNTRWLGGMLTNFQTIFSRLQRLTELRKMEESGAFDFLPKKEVLKLRHEKEKLERNLGGIQEMTRVPDAVFIIDTLKEHIALTEANKLRVPVIAIVDTNCDPDQVDFVIPGNDDAIRSVDLIATVLADAIEEGRQLGAKDAVDRVSGDGDERQAAPREREAAHEKPEPEAAAEQPEVAEKPQAAAVSEEPEIVAETAAAPGPETPVDSPTPAEEAVPAEPEVGGAQAEESSPAAPEAEDERPATEGHDAAKPESTES